MLFSSFDNVRLEVECRHQAERVWHPSDEATNNINFKRDVYVYRQVLVQKWWVIKLIWYVFF